MPWKLQFFDVTRVEFSKIHGDKRVCCLSQISWGRKIYFSYIFWVRFIFRGGGGVMDFLLLPTIFLCLLNIVCLKKTCFPIIFVVTPHTCGDFLIHKEVFFEFAGWARSLGEAWFIFLRLICFWEREGVGFFWFASVKKTCAFWKRRLWGRKNCNVLESFARNDFFFCWNATCGERWYISKYFLEINNLWEGGVGFKAVKFIILNLAGLDTNVTFVFEFKISFSFLFASIIFFSFSNLIKFLKICFLKI